MGLEEFLLCAGVGLMLTASVRAADSASGALQIGNERHAVKYAFAVLEPDGMEDDAKEKLSVLLSDTPVPDELRKANGSWLSWAVEQASTGAMHGVVLDIDPATGKWSSGHTLTGGLASYSGVGGFGFVPAGPIGDQVAGRVWMKEPWRGVSADDPAWRVEGEFQCTVVRRPAVSAVFTGPAAIDSPPYKAFAALMAACQRKDLEGIRKGYTPRSWKGLEMGLSQDKAGTLNFLAAASEEVAKLKVLKVTVRSDMAQVELGDGERGSGHTHAWRLTLSNGEWKVDE
jgi:hypothetical protein